MEYSATVRDHFANPRNIGQLESTRDVVCATAGSVEQGAKFWLSARIAAGRVQDVRHRVFGCPHCIAAASFASEQLVGASVDQLRNWGWRDLAQRLDVPAEKRGRLLVLEDAIRALGAAWPADPSSHAETS